MTASVEFKIILHHNRKQKQSFCHLSCVGRLPKLGMTSVMTNLRNAKLRNADDEVMRPR